MGALAVRQIAIRFLLLSRGVAMDIRTVKSILRLLVLIIFGSVLYYLGYTVIHLKDQSRFLLILPVLTVFLVFAIYLFRDNQ